MGGTAVDVDLAAEAGEWPPDGAGSSPTCSGSPHHDDHQVHGSTPVDSQQLFAERAEMLQYCTVLAAEARALASELGL
jgi:hypothetical protein